MINQHHKKYIEVFYMIGLATFETESQIDGSQKNSLVNTHKKLTEFIIMNNQSLKK